MEDNMFTYKMEGDLYVTPEITKGTWTINRNKIILTTKGDNDRFLEKYKFKIQGDSLQRKMFVYHRQQNK